MSDHQPTNEQASVAQLQALMQADAVLPAAINGQQAKPASKTAKAILLIGATGIVGPYLLREMLQQTTAIIYCLIRKQPDISLEQYLKNHLATYQLTDIYQESRIICIAGDIATINLGLSTTDYQFLATEIDSIFHSAAWTNHVRPYTNIARPDVIDLRKTNTLSVLYSLKLAVTKKVKAFHFISTVGAINRADLAGNLVEELPQTDNDTATADLNAGYIQSKFIAEKLIYQAILRGVPSYVYRLGQITGDSESGLHYAAKDHMMLELKSSIQLGCAPAWSDHRSFVAVNVAANIIVAMMQQQEVMPGGINIQNPSVISWREIIATLVEHGYRINIISEMDWLNKIKQLEQTNALYPLRMCYDEKGGFLEQVPALKKMFNGQVQLTKMLAATKTAAAYFPSSKELLDKYISYFIDDQFFPPPSV